MYSDYTFKHVDGEIWGTNPHPNICCSESTKKVWKSINFRRLSFAAFSPQISAAIWGRKQAPNFRRLSFAAVFPLPTSLFSEHVFTIDEKSLEIDDFLASLGFAVITFDFGRI